MYRPPDVGLIGPSPGKISFGPWIPASSNESIENYRQDNKYEIQISRNKTQLRETTVFNFEEHKGDSVR